MLRREDIQVLEKGSPAYPEEWLALSDAPERVYAIGNIALLSARKITVVGSRRTPVQAVKLGGEIAKELSTHFALVTGVAEGGDSAVIEGALLGTGDIICVLAGGLNALPQGNLTLLERVAKKGLLLSPCPLETGVRNFSYEYRNKLLALLGVATLVLGAGEKSGALITARYAKEAGKRVFALPYSPWTSAGKGCNVLIKAGAGVAENAEDILTAFGIEKRQMSTLILTDEEARVLAYVREEGEAHATAVAQNAGVPVFKIRALLASLEVKGAVIAVGGNRYSAINK